MNFTEKIIYFPKPRRDLGFTITELLMGVAMVGIGIVVFSSFFRTMLNEQKKIQTELRDITSRDKLTLGVDCARTMNTYKPVPAVTTINSPPIPAAIDVDCPTSSDTPLKLMSQGGATLLEASGSNVGGRIYRAVCKNDDFVNRIKLQSKASASVVTWTDENYQLNCPTRYFVFGDPSNYWILLNGIYYGKSINSPVGNPSFLGWNQPALPSLSKTENTITYTSTTDPSGNSGAMICRAAFADGILHYKEKHNNSSPYTERYWSWDLANSKWVASLPAPGTSQSKEVRCVRPQL